MYQTYQTNNYGMYKCNIFLTTFIFKVLTCFGFIDCKWIQIQNVECVPSRDLKPTRIQQSLCIIYLQQKSASPGKQKVQTLFLSNITKVAVVTEVSRNWFAVVRPKAGLRLSLAILLHVIPPAGEPGRAGCISNFVSNVFPLYILTMLYLQYGYRNVGK